MQPCGAVGRRLRGGGRGRRFADFVRASGGEICGPLGGALFLQTEFRTWADPQLCRARMCGRVSADSRLRLCAASRLYCRGEERTSFFTTGGIRGGKRKLDKFYPRSFNMGVRREVYEALGGFSRMRFGEDIDFSIRIFKEGYACRLFPEAWVWHKRRTDFRKFFRQVFNSGVARINLYKKYPSSLKLVHLLPACFVLGVLCLLLLSFFSAYALLPLLLYVLLIFVDASLLNGSLLIGALSVVASFTQLAGYGCGFLVAFWRRVICGKGEYEAFKKNFYK